MAIDAPLVDRRGVVVADEHRGDAHLLAAQAQVGDLGADVVEEFGGEGAPVDEAVIQGGAQCGAARYGLGGDRVAPALCAAARSPVGTSASSNVDGEIMAGRSSGEREYALLIAELHALDEEGGAVEIVAEARDPPPEPTPP